MGGQQEKPWRLTDREELLALKDRALEAAAEGVVIADARLPDMPLIYVNRGFERLTGYSAESVLGRNCRFLQGDGTDSEAGREIKRAIEGKQECVVEILNYRKDGTPFWNRLSITPIYDAAGQLTHFIGVQSDITQRKMAEEGLHQAKLQLEAVNRRMTMELEMAAGIQQMLLPSKDASYQNVDVAWLFQPCVELAGDTLNVLALDDRRIAFYIVDVSGHGVGSALLSVTLSRWLTPMLGRFAVVSRTGDDAVAIDIGSPASIAAHLNQLFPMMDGVPQYFTMLFGILDRRDGTFRYVSAGHPGPILVPSSGEPKCLPGEGFPVGLLPGAYYQDRQVQLQPGDRLFLFTDGIPDAMNGTDADFGIDRMKQTLSAGRGSSLQSNLDAVLAALRSWCGGIPFHDDITMLGFEYRP